MVVGGLADDYTTWCSGGTGAWNPKGYRTPSVSSGASSISSRQFSLVKSPRGRAPSSESSPTTQSQASHQPSQTRPNSPTAPSRLSPPLFQVLPYYEVRLTSGRGYGAFALQDIPKGTDIFSEAPLFQATVGNIAAKFSNLSQADKELYLSLYGWEGGRRKRGKIEAIFRTNLFEIPSGSPGIFPHASRFNHACIPSLSYRFHQRTRQMVFTTKREIAKGEEITVSYCGGTWNLKANYGFTCSCDYCGPLSAEITAYEKQRPVLMEDEDRTRIDWEVGE